jgi:hypothetical protein
MARVNKNGVKYSAIVLSEEPREDFIQHIDTILTIFDGQPEEFELLIVANGTENFLRKQLERIRNHSIKLKVMSLNKKTPQAVCLKIAYKEATGEILVVFGSYQQITEDSFHNLLNAFDDDTDIISPWRENRVDPRINQIQSQLFNYVVNRFVVPKIHDLSCTVKLFRREVIEKCQLYGNMYRFLPIIAELKGFKNKEVGCEHYQEYGKVGFYGFSVYFTRLIDILTLFFTIHFSRKPLRFFSSCGFIFGTVGGLLFLYVLLQKLIWQIPIGGRAVLVLAVLFIVLGVQFFSVGLLGEIIAFTFGRYRKEYSVKKII